VLSEWVAINRQDKQEKRGKVIPDTFATRVLFRGSQEWFIECKLKD